MRINSSTHWADIIAFNSQYNRSTFVQGAKALLEKLPDRLSPDLLEKIGESEVLPVPLEKLPIEAAKTAGYGASKSLEVVWNHRWEYDKGPQLLLRVAEAISQQQLPIRLHVVGQQFRSSPAEFETLAPLLQQHAAALGLDRGSFGFIENRTNYLELLRRCDVVLSTALHDFQGLAIQEATALGCTPLVPEALVYPEYVGSEFRYLFDEHADEATHCANILAQLQRWQSMKSANQALPKLALNEFSQEELKPRYTELLERLVSVKKS